MKKIIGLKKSIKYVKDVLRVPGRSKNNTEVNLICMKIINEVIQNGESAIKKFSNQFDNSNRENFLISQEEINVAFDTIDISVTSAIKKSISRSEEYHKNSMPKSWINNNKTIGEKVIPVDKALCYVPGGSAPLVSTAIMTIVPAKIAGVDQIFVATPPSSNKISNEIIVASVLSGADKMYAVGGIQAIAGFTYGAGSLPKVDVICGPGNKYVTEAKKCVYGDVGIDGLYGPTETLIIADNKSDPILCASDLIAQAEHDYEATPLLITDSEIFADKVKNSIKIVSKSLSRSSIIDKSVSDKGVIFIVEKIEDSIELSNLISSEHVSILLDNFSTIKDGIKNAGGMFVGEHSAEVFGDYIAGPSHVMPTGGSARFNSALNVRHFLKFQPLINLSESEVLSLVDDVVVLARIEGLDGHKQSALLRKKNLIGE